MKAFLISLLAIFSAVPAAGQEAHAPANLGFYCGLSTLYPYGPVYSDKGNCLGASYGGMDVRMLPRSAPLPPSEKYCEWADPGETFKPIKGSRWATMSGTGWYQWTPRAVPQHLKQYVEETRICYLEDRGKPKDLTSLKR